MKAFFVIGILLSCFTLPLCAQQKEIERLIDAYEILYYNRINDTVTTEENIELAFYNYYSYPERVQFKNHADSILAGIHNIKKIQKKFPFVYAKFQVEYYALKLLNGLDSAKTTDYPRLKQFADSLDEYYQVKPSKKEIYRLKKNLSIRYLSLMNDNKEFYEFFTDPYDGLLANLTKLKLKYIQNNPEALSTDELILLNIHDYLFTMQNDDAPLVKTELQRRYNQAQNELTKIKDIARLKELYPQTFKAADYEIKLLAWQLANTSKDSLSTVQQINLIGQVLSFLPNDYIGAAELLELKKIAGVGRFTIAEKDYDDYSLRLIIQYNHFVLELLDKEIRNKNSIQGINTNSIDSLYNISKKWLDTYADSTSNAIFRNDLIEIVKRFNYGKGEFYLKNKIYDSAWYYLVLAELVGDFRSQYNYNDIVKNMPVYKKNIADSLHLNLAVIDNNNYKFSNKLNEYYLLFSNTRISSDLNEVVVVGYGSTKKFPRNPPIASCRADRLRFKAPIKTLFEANEILSNALKQAGYPQWDYYEIDGGFAIVAPFEQLENDGSPKPDPPRFLEKISVMDNFSFSNYFKALLHGLQGYYRVFIFLITDDIVSFSDPQTDLNLHDFEGGGNGLPDSIEPTDPYTAKHSCTVLVYEFEKLNKNDPAKFIVSSKLNAKKHLSRVSLSAIFK